MSRIGSPLKSLAMMVGLMSAQTFAMNLPPERNSRTPWRNPFEDQRYRSSPGLRQRLRWDHHVKKNGIGMAGRKLGKKAAKGKITIRQGW